jgi:hypothetical protein
MKIGWTLSNPDGTVAARKELFPANSLLAQFIKILFNHFSAFGVTVPVLDTGGVSRTLASASLTVNAGSGVKTSGIMIGTGTNAVGLNDIALQTPVTANWTYGATTVAYSNPSGNIQRVSITRGFTNTTGAQVTIRELGLYSTNASAQIFCIERTLVNVAVNNNQVLTVVYTLDTDLT